MAARFVRAQLMSNALPEKGGHAKGVHPAGGHWIEKAFRTSQSWHTPQSMPAHSMDPSEMPYPLPLLQVRSHSPVHLVFKQNEYKSCHACVMPQAYLYLPKQCQMSITAAGFPGLQIVGVLVISR